LSVQSVTVKGNSDMDLFAPLLRLFGPPSAMGRHGGSLQNALASGFGGALLGRAYEEDPQDEEEEEESKDGGSGFVDSILSIFDSNHDGLLTRLEAKKAASQFDIGSRELKDILKGLNCDKKTEEVALSSLSDQIKLICVEKFKKAAFKLFFNCMDKDKSGTLSMDEVIVAVRAFNMPVTMSIAKEIFDSVDTNKDGEIDLKEFLAFLASVKDFFSRMISLANRRLTHVGGRNSRNTSFSESKLAQRNERNRTDIMGEVYPLLATSFPILHAEVISSSKDNMTNQSTNVASDITSTPDNLSFQFSIWLIVLLSLTSLFAIWFILCGLFRRADAYRMPGMDVPGYGFGEGYDLGFGGGGLNAIGGAGGGGSLFSGLNYDADV
uniref:Calmodulin n=2 Tax=Hymenolepis diminuta TaxID=6216 RepID=A0A158QC10_HYMDI